jgi:hypothetical protein
MRTTLILPEGLLDEVQRLAGKTSKTQAVVTALESYVLRARMDELLALKGKIPIDYDWEEAEAAELKAAEAREKYRGR